MEVWINLSQKKNVIIQSQEVSSEWDISRVISVVKFYPRWDKLAC